MVWDTLNLYALLISAQTPDQQVEVIFNEVVRNPRVNFPLIVTDARGEVQWWKGPGLPPSGYLSAADRQALRGSMLRMDSANPPIAPRYSAEEPSYLHYGGRSSFGKITLWPYIRVGALLLALLLVGNIAVHGFSAVRNAVRGNVETKPASTWVGGT